MSERNPITKQGFEALSKRLKQLLEVERPQIVRDIEVARSHGDLKENAEYHSAKEKQGFIEAKINQLNEMIANCDVIDISKLSGDTVKFGATVTYVNVDTEEEITYTILGQDESDIAMKKISITSPIARALLGKSVGDEVEIAVPKGKITVEISEIKYVS